MVLHICLLKVLLKLVLFGLLMVREGLPVLSNLAGLEE